MQLLTNLCALMLVSASSYDAPNCTKGKACGNTCIATNKTCHVGTRPGAGDDRNIGAFIRQTSRLEPDPQGLSGDTEPAGNDEPVVEAQSPSSGQDEAGTARQPAQSANVPPHKLCRRAEFDDFDDFVDCRIEEERARRPAPTKPAVDPAEAARQREADEVSAELAKRTRERARAKTEGAQSLRRTILALAIPGAVLDATGIGLIAGAYVLGENIPASADQGPHCTVGKRCGQTCIALELTCHTPTAGGSSTRPHPALLWSGVATIAAGTGLLVAALVIYRNNKPGTSFLVNARGVGFRF